MRSEATAAAYGCEYLLGTEGGACRIGDAIAGRPASPAPQALGAAATPQLVKYSWMLLTVALL